MKKQTLLAIFFLLGILAKSQAILPPYNNEAGYYGELNNIMRFAARMSTCEEAKQYAGRITAYAKEHPIALAQGNTINNCVEYANNKLAKILENCDANGTSTTDASGDVKPEDLVSALNKPLNEQKEIAKKFFIQNGYKYINESNCGVDVIVANESTSCLIFSEFKLHFQDTGIELWFNKNVDLMRKMSDKLTALGIENSPNEFYDNGNSVYFVQIHK